MLHIQRARHSSDCVTEWFTQQPDTESDQPNGERVVWGRTERGDVWIQDCPVYHWNALAQCDDMLCRQHGHLEYLAWTADRSSPVENQYCLKLMEYECRNPALEWVECCGLHIHTHTHTQLRCTSIVNSDPLMENHTVKCNSKLHSTYENVFL